MAAHFTSLPVSVGHTSALASGLQRNLTGNSGFRQQIQPVKSYRQVLIRAFTTRARRRTLHASSGASVSQQPTTAKASEQDKLRAAAPAIVAALRLTHAFKVASALAIHLIFDIKHVFGRKAEETQQTITQAQQTIQQAVEQPAQRMSQAESELKAAFARLQQHAVAGGEALIRMLHSLDKPSITLDTKWKDMQEQLAGNKDVSDRLQQLYDSSTESAKTVAAMLAENNGSLHPSYFTSSQTKQVIDQEEELRSVVFAQMLGATS